jgi:hypothetical protein
MTWSQTDLDTLDRAIASGERRVRLQDKEVEFRTIDEMLQIRSLISNSLEPTQKIGMKRIQMVPDKGYL